MHGLGLEYVPPRNSKAEGYQDVAWTCAMLYERAAVKRLKGLTEPIPPGRVSRHAVALHVISGRLHKLAENQCNYGLSKRQETAESNLTRAANEIAAHYGCRAYVQGDPRGCSLYLIPAELVPQSLEKLDRYVWEQERAAQNFPSLDKLQSRWVDAHYSSGHAVSRLS